MTLDTLRANLKQTIAGKEEVLELYTDKLSKPFAPDDVTRFAIKATVEFLTINIDELKRILTDVELCINHASANSWAGSVDRMSGAFDESELRGRDGWL
jgi:hypothetical protein